jgi:hypothetical protein
MSTVKITQSARTLLTSTGFATLASATYVASSAYNLSASNPLDLLVEVECGSTNVVAGNKQVVVFAQASLDGTNFQSGPTSGTTTTDEGDLTYIGVVPVATASTTHRKAFSVFTAFGYLPQQVKFVLKNDLGVALTSGNVYTAEIVGTTV